MINWKRKILPLTIFLISFCLLLLEIFMTRIFSVLLYHHFAFMAISIALLGLGISGMVIYFFPKFFSKKRSYKLMGWGFILFSLSVLVALFSIIFARVEIAVNLSSIIQLIVLYVLLTLPFFFGGIVISLILTHFSKKVSKLYFYDLIGASLGSIGVIFLLNYVGGPNGLLFIALIGLVGAIILGFYLKLKTIKILSIILFIAVIILFLIGLIYTPFTLEFTRGAEDSESKEFSSWNAISRVDVFNHSADHKTILIDSDASTVVHHIEDDIYEESYLMDDLRSLAYVLKQDSEVLIIGVGGGKDVISALLYNNTVIGIEINDIIVNDLMKDELSEYSGNLYLRDDVEVYVAEGRSYVRRSEEKYGVLQMSLVDTFAATAAGAFTLTENNLYTVEALEEYFMHLEDDGIFSSTRYVFEKPQETLKLVGISLEALENLGIEDLQNNLVLIEEEMWYNESLERPRTPISGTANLLVKKSGFSEEEVDLLVAKADEQGFDVLYNPFEENDNVFNDLILSDDRQAFYDSYEFDVQPSVDDKPFFFYSLRFKDAFNIKKWFSNEYEEDLVLKVNLGFFIMLITLGLTVILALAFLLVPLLLIKRNDLKGDTGKKITILLYFLGIGLGFITLEIVFMQKFILFLGHPVYALGVILASLLVFGGIGSFTTDKIKENARSKVLSNFIALIVVVIIYYFLLPYVFTIFIGHSLFVRIILSVLLLLPLGVIMGRFFPIGIKIVDQNFHKMIPWVWAVNGTASVVGSVLAILFALNLGFNATIFLGVFWYILTLGVVLKKV
jgi:hypothetical protein